MTNTRILDITNLDSLIDLLKAGPKKYKNGRYIQPFMRVLHATLGCSMCCRCANEECTLWHQINIDDGIKAIVLECEYFIPLELNIEVRIE
jgi:hypothetical protein